MVEDVTPGGGVRGISRTLAGIPAVWRGVGAAAGITAVFATRSGVTGLFDEILGLTLVATAILEQVPRYFGGVAPRWWRSVAIGSIGVLIFVWPSETAESLGTLAAAAIAIYGLSKIVKGIGTPSGPLRRDRLARGALVILVAVVVALFPGATLRIVVLLAGAVWVFEATIIGAAVGRSGGAVDPNDGRSITSGDLEQWVDRQMDPAEHDRVDAVLFLDSGDRRRRLFRFAVLMVLAAALGAFGIASDSTAVVIGAMLIAPLMIPILATAASLLRNHPRSAFRSLAIALAASAGAAGVAWVVAAFIPNLDAVMRNGEVASRTAPNLLDLAIALTAGAAGTFAVCRSDVSETLPGVAVAIALVPPLAVCGLSLHAGDLDAAMGSLLLFTTNLLAILAVAGIVFLLTGYVSWNELRRHGRHVRTSYAAVAAGVVMLVIPLGLAARTLIREASMERSSQGTVEEWLGDVDGLILAQIDVTRDRVEVVLRGNGETPSPERLHEALIEDLGSDVELRLRVVPESIVVVGGTQ